ncbi:MAG: c-type cytochrome [Betaproteobacteria bacterium]|nr:c-type cytochrome [Betaproteobacteria bacterium]
MKYLILSLPLLFAVACTSQSKVESGSGAGASKIGSCIACHGADGRSGKEGVPPLADRSREELVAAMERVRDAYAPQPLIGHDLNDQEIQDIAAYFSAQ